MKLTLGPLFFHWPVQQICDFYTRIAHEAPIDEVYVGEVICSKRAAFMEPYWQGVIETLRSCGKEIIFSTLAEAVDESDRALIAQVCQKNTQEIETNDITALSHLCAAERAYRLGQMLNVYNEETLAILVRKGATHVCLPAEMHEGAIMEMARAAKDLGVGVEVQVFGRVPLALSARCYSARSVSRVRKGCQFACANSAPDGTDLRTLEGQEIFAINGIQVLSHGFLNLATQISALRTAGVTHLRLSPHSADMVAIAKTFRAVVDGTMKGHEANRSVRAAGVALPFSNGFFHHKPGHLWIEDMQE